MYRELGAYSVHASGQMDVCHANKEATSACTLMYGDGIRMRGRGVNQMTKHVGANWFHHTLVSSMLIVNPFHSIASIVASLDCSATGYPCRAHNSSKMIAAVQLVGNTGDHLLSACYS